MLEVDLVPVAPAEFVAPPARRRRSARPGPPRVPVHAAPALAPRTGAPGRRPGDRPGRGPRRLLVRLGPLHRDAGRARDDPGRRDPQARPGRLRRDGRARRRTPRACRRAAVVGTDPDPGARVLDHGTIALTLSLGKERYDVPKVQGLDVDHAQDALAAGAPDLRPLDPALVRHRAARHRDRRATRRQGTRQRPGTVVDLVVSRGPRPVHLTDWTGKNAARADARPHRPAPRGARRREEYSDPVPEGLVISQDPPTGVLHHGDTVKLVVSKGPRAGRGPGQPPRDGRRGGDPAPGGPRLHGRRSTTPTSTSASATSRAPAPGGGDRAPQGEHRHPPHRVTTLAWCGCPPPPTSRRTTLLATAALLAVTACWGSTFFLIHDLLERVPTLDFLAHPVRDRQPHPDPPRAAGARPADPRVAPPGRRARLPLRRRADPADRRARRDPGQRLRLHHRDVRRGHPGVRRADPAHPDRRRSPGPPSPWRWSAWAC